MLRALFLGFVLLAASPAHAADALVSGVETIGRTPSDLVVERVNMNAVPVALDKVEMKLADMPVEVPKVIAALKAKLAAKNIAPAGAAMVQFEETGEGVYAASVMLPVTDAPKDIKDLKFSTSPAVKALRVVHKGPLSSIEDSYFELQTFVEDQGLDVGTFSVERYVTDFTATTAKDMITEIYVPLE